MIVATKKVTILKQARTAKIARVENSGQDNDGRKCKAGKMQDMTVEDKVVFVFCDDDTGIVASTAAALSSVSGLSSIFSVPITVTEWGFIIAGRRTLGQDDCLV